MVVGHLYAASSAYASRHGGKHSIYSYPGIPLLFSCLRAFLVDCNDMSDIPGSDEALCRLANDANELSLLRDRYLIEGQQMIELDLFYEVRNEIIHPAPRSVGTDDQTPDYLRSLRTKGLLSTFADDPPGGHAWMHQLQSHKLFEAVFQGIECVMLQVATVHGTWEVADVKAWFAKARSVGL